MGFPKLLGEEMLPVNVTFLGHYSCLVLSCLHVSTPVF
jgi:hypothetical protein